MPETSNRTWHDPVGTVLNTVWKHTDRVIRTPDYGNTWVRATSRRRLFNTNEVVVEVKRVSVLSGSILGVDKHECGQIVHLSKSTYFRARGSDPTRNPSSTSWLSSPPSRKARSFSSPIPPAYLSPPTTARPTTGSPDAMSRGEFLTSKHCNSSKLGSQSPST
jgi:hypothetical protein